jgi:hypothetical protein
VNYLETKDMLLKQREVGHFILPRCLFRSGKRFSGYFDKDKGDVQVTYHIFPAAAVFESEERRRNNGRLASCSWVA